MVKFAQELVSERVSFALLSRKKFWITSRTIPLKKSSNKVTDLYMQNPRRRTKLWILAILRGVIIQVHYSFAAQRASCHNNDFNDELRYHCSMNGKPEIDEARTCKPQILMISPKFFMTEVCKMMIRSHRTNKVLIKNPLLAINRFPNCRWLYFSSSLISSFERCRFVTQIRDFSYVKLQHECSSFSLTLKMRQNYILDEGWPNRFSCLNIPITLYLESKFFYSGIIDLREVRVHHHRCT